jgi:hypothetical protein
MTSNEKLDRLLDELKEENAQLLPPAFIATRLRVEATRVANRRRRRLAMSLLIPTFALALLAAVVLRWPTEIGYRPQTRNISQTSTNHTRPSDGVEQGQQPFLSSASYIDLPSSVALPEPIDTTVVQVVLRKEELRQFGFAVSDVHSSELTRADFILGEDGIARSVRLVGPVEGISIQSASTTGSQS